MLSEHLQKKKTEKGKDKPEAEDASVFGFFYLNDSTPNELAASTQLQKANRAPAAMVQKKKKKTSALQS